jgi:hypothetical protein
MRIPAAARSLAFPTAFEAHRIHPSGLAGAHIGELQFVCRDYGAGRNANSASACTLSTLVLRLVIHRAFTFSSRLRDVQR